MKFEDLSQATKEKIKVEFSKLKQDTRFKKVARKKNNPKEKPQDYTLFMCYDSPKEFQESTAQKSCYVIGNIIGAGSFGTVYDCLKIDLNADGSYGFETLAAKKVDFRDVASRTKPNRRREQFIKETNNHSAREYEKSSVAHKIRDEFEIGKALGTNNASFIETDKAWAFYNKIKGVELESLIMEDTLSETQKEILLVNLLVELSNVHFKGYSLLDIKPANILVDPQTLDVTYIDFGLSAKHDLSDVRPGGTKEYMAPEMYFKYYRENVSIPGIRSSPLDVYSLGATILALWSKSGQVYDEDFYENSSHMINYQYHKQEQTFDIHSYNQMLINNAAASLLDFLKHDGRSSTLADTTPNYVIDLINNMTRFDPSRRPSCIEALQNIPDYRETILKQLQDKYAQLFNGTKMDDLTRNTLGLSLHEELTKKIQYITPPAARDSKEFELKIADSLKDLPDLSKFRESVILMDLLSFMPYGEKSNSQANRLDLQAIYNASEFMERYSDLIQSNAQFKNSMRKAMVELLHLYPDYSTPIRIDKTLGEDLFKMIDKSMKMLFMPKSSVYLQFLDDNVQYAASLYAAGPSTQIAQPVVTTQARVPAQAQPRPGQPPTPLFAVSRPIGKPPLAPRAPAPNENNGSELERVFAARAAKKAAELEKAAGPSTALAGSGPKNKK